MEQKMINTIEGQVSRLRQHGDIDNLRVNWLGERANMQRANVLLNQYYDKGEIKNFVGLLVLMIDKLKTNSVGWNEQQERFFELLDEIFDRYEIKEKEVKEVVTEIQPIKKKELKQFVTREEFEKEFERGMEELRKITREPKEDIEKEETEESDEIVEGF